MYKAKIIITTFLFTIIFNSFAQTIEKPNSAIASHPLTINKIEISDNQVIIELELENKSATGYFCADKSINLYDITRKIKYELVSSKGIPVCPSTYKFRKIGEVLKFQLYFPKLLKGTKYINIVENCNSNCFSILGVIIDTEMNTEINLGFDYYYKGKLDFALSAFLNVIKNNSDYPFGYLYANVIQIYVEKNDFESAKKWYQKVKNSNFTDKEYVLNNIKAKPYYSKLIF